MTHTLVAIYLAGIILSTMFLVIASVMTASGWPHGRDEWGAMAIVVFLWPLVMVFGMFL